MKTPDRATLDPDTQLADALEALLHTARDQENTGNAPAALATLQSAPEALHGFGSYQYARGALLARTGDIDEAIVAFEKAVAFEPEVAEMKANLGAALLTRAQAQGPQGITEPAPQADLQRALEVLAEGAEQHPRLPEVHANHGRALTLAGQIDRALKAFEQALAMDPTHLPALYNQAAALSAAGRHEESLTVLDEILRIAPDFAPAQQSRANTLKRLGR